MNLVYLIGAPGVGKTTLMEALTAACTRRLVVEPFAHEWLYRDGELVGVELGRRRGSFAGTDALSMSVGPEASRWVRRCRARLVLGEGARLATRRFLYAARSAGYRITLVHLVAPAAVLDERRARRGSAQDPAWMRGAESRAARLAAQLRYDAAVHELDATAPVQDLVADLVKCEPVLEVLGAGPASAGADLPGGA